MNLREVQKLISSVANSGTSEFKLNSDEVKIVVKANKEDKELQLIPPVSSEDHIVPVTQVSEVPKKIVYPNGNDLENIDINDDSKYYTVKSPIIGTCFLQSSIGEAKFIKNGDIIKEGDVLCTIESLKLFNVIKSDVSGKIKQVIIEDFSPVEYDQSLFIIEL